MNEFLTLMVQSFVSPKCEIKKSKIHGRGLFAKESMAKDEIVAIKGGHIMTESELLKSETFRDFTFFQIEDGLYIGAKKKSEVKANKLFINHSCKPNVGFKGQITFVAMQDIRRREELTFDWAMCTDESYFWKGWKIQCLCKSSNCRKVLAGHDWKRKDLQRKYAGYFSTFISERIRF